MENDIELYCQPAYSYLKSNVEYVEVLIRKYNGINGVDKILKYVGDNHKEFDLDMAVLRKTISTLDDYGNIGVPVGVNLCAKTPEIKGLADEIIQTVYFESEYNHEIIIEVNEETDFENKVVEDNLRRLKRAGIKLALDDFGAKNATLGLLMKYKMDIIKVDKILTEDETEEKENSSSVLLRTIGFMIRGLNIKHIVEGIETDRQLENAISAGMDVVQGYLYEKPKQFQMYLEENFRVYEKAN